MQVKCSLSAVSREYYRHCFRSCFARGSIVNDNAGNLNRMSGSEEKSQARRTLDSSKYRVKLCDANDARVSFHDATETLRMTFLRYEKSFAITPFRRTPLFRAYAATKHRVRRRVTTAIVRTHHLVGNFLFRELKATCTQRHSAG